jgi:Protein of unknown function (DUF3313)
MKPMPLKPTPGLRALLGLCLALALSQVQAAGNKQVEAAMSHDGLSKISIRGIDLVYARPGATLAGYKSVKLDPVEVAFDKNWDPRRSGSSFRLDAADRESIRTGVARIVFDEFVRELQSRNAFPVVTESGPDVLRVKINIVDLYVTAPDTMSAGRTRTYVMSAGQMTLVAELYDSESGQVLARAVDTREARNTGRLQLSSSVVNAAEARDIASAWARILHNALDKAHGIGRTK